MQRIRNTMKWLAALLCLSAPAHATQMLEVDESKTTFVQISNREPTLIRLQGDEFSTIKYRESAAVVEKDEQHGFIYLTPSSHEAFNVFVTTKLGRVINMLFKPASVPGDSLVLMLDDVPARLQPEAEPVDYVTEMKWLLTVAANDQYEHGVTKKDESAVVALWNEAHFIRHASYIARDLTAEAYRLKNISSQPMVVVEQELYKKGVLGVSVERHQLAPGESTNVFIIKRTVEES